MVRCQHQTRSARWHRNVRRPEIAVVTAAPFTSACTTLWDAPAAHRRIASDGTSYGATGGSGRSRHSGPRRGSEARHAGKGFRRAVRGASTPVNVGGEVEGRAAGLFDWCLRRARPPRRVRVLFPRRTGWGDEQPYVSDRRRVECRRRRERCTDPSCERPELRPHRVYARFSAGAALCARHISLGVAQRWPSGVSEDMGRILRRSVQAGLGLTFHTTVDVRRRSGGRAAAADVWSSRGAASPMALP